jgi:hypothetical protein
VILCQIFEAFLPNDDPIKHTSLLRVTHIKILHAPLMKQGQTGNTGIGISDILMDSHHCVWVSYETYELFGIRIQH